MAGRAAGSPLPDAIAAASAHTSLAMGPRGAFAGVVLGIDPSLRGTGLALIEFAPGHHPLLLRCRRGQRGQAAADPVRLLPVRLLAT